MRKRGRINAAAGQPCPFDRIAANAVLEGEMVPIRLLIGDGAGKAQVSGCDLSDPRGSLW